MKNGISMVIWSTIWPMSVFLLLHVVISWHDQSKNVEKLATYQLESSHVSNINLLSIHGPCFFEPVALSQMVFIDEHDDCNVRFSKIQDAQNVWHSGVLYVMTFKKNNDSIFFVFKKIFKNSWIGNAQTIFLFLIFASFSILTVFGSPLIKIFILPLQICAIVFSVMHFDESFISMMPKLNQVMDSWVLAFFLSVIFGFLSYNNHKQNMGGYFNIIFSVLVGCFALWSLTTHAFGFFVCIFEYSLITTTLKWLKEKAEARQCNLQEKTA